MLRSLPSALASLVILAFAGSALAIPAVAKLTTGDPEIKSIDTIAIAEGGVLLIADGTTSRIVAVQTDDTAKLNGDGPKIQNIVHEIAGRLGAADKDVEIARIAVNSVSGRTYVLVKKLDEKKNLIVTVDPDGKIAALSLKNVKFSAVNLPKAAAGAPRVMEMAWAGDRVVCSARTSEEFASKILVIPAPISPEAAFGMISAETYHVSHKKWETKAPMSAIFPYEENGKKYIVGGFGCTPIVKFPIDAIQNGEKVKGESMIELGSGNRPINMFAYTKDGKPSVIVNTFRFFHEKSPISPNAYWTCRFDRAILAAEQINEKALRRDIKAPEDPKVTMVAAFHGVRLMDKLDESRAVVLKEHEDKRLDLEVVALP
jgi:hypothetical protein